MKKLILLPILLFLIACNLKESEKKVNTENKVTSDTVSKERELSIETDSLFGNDFETKQVKSKEEILAVYEGLQIGDTLEIQFQSKIQDVCAKKGCWMKLELPEDKNTHVTFKDYSFFVPKDSKDHKMLVNGIAFIEETDVETLKHYAEDAGKSEEEIAGITESQLNYRFIADGAKAVK